MNGAIVVTIINSGVEAVANQVRNIVENTVMNASIGTEDTILERFNIISCQEKLLALLVCDGIFRNKIQVA